MAKALSELMVRHDVVLQPPRPVALTPPCPGPMTLSGLASTLDVDCERVAFARAPSVPTRCERT